MAFFFDSYGVLPLLIVLFFFGVTCGGFCATLADNKGWNPGPWFIGGFLLGPLALVAAAGMPDLKLRKYIRAMAQGQGVVVPWEGGSATSGH